MKRSLIAIAALLLLLSSTTYASPPRAPRRSRFFWGPLLAWFSFGHHHDGRMARHDEYGRRPPSFVPEHRRNPGRHLGWERGRHYGWDRNDQPRGRRPGNGRPHEGEQGHGRGGGRGRG